MKKNELIGFLKEAYYINNFKQASAMVQIGKHRFLKHDKIDKVFGAKGSDLYIKTRTEPDENPGALADQAEKYLMKSGFYFT